jgi:hypothetical protein
MTHPVFDATDVPMPLVAQTDQQGRVQHLATEWTSLPSVVDVRLATRALSDDEALGTVQIERRSDGEKLDLSMVASNQNGAARSEKLTLLASSEDQYRFVLTPTGTWMYEACDIGLEMPDALSIRKELRSTRLVDLRTMTGAVTDANNTLVVYPNPASSQITIVISGVVAGTLTVSDALGKVVWSSSASASDIIALETDQWTQGLYTVALIPDVTGNPTSRKHFLITH